MSSKFSRKNYLFLPLLAAIVLTLSQVSSHDAYAAPIWSASGPGNVAVTESDQGINGQAQFTYYINMGGGGVPTKTWTFETIATQTGPITLDYDWTGFHAFFQVTTFLNKFDSTGTTNLVSQGPVNCCTSPSSGFHYTGSVTINAVAGQPYGFTLGGSNFDSNSVLSGTFTVKIKDTTSPVVTIPAPITTTATSPSGATVTFITSATDPDDAAGPVQCNPSSGSTFPIGITTVTCTSTDTHGNTGTASFIVTVVPPAPVITSPASGTTFTAHFGSSSTPVTVSGTSLAGSTITVYDGTTPLGTTSSTGSWSLPTTLSVETHSITATATLNGQTSAPSNAVSVTIQTPQQAIQQLATLKESMGLPQGLVTSLDAKLTAASNSLDSSDTKTASNQLGAFINEVNAQTGKKITQDQANQLVSGAQNVISSIS